MDDGGSNVLQVEVGINRGTIYFPDARIAIAVQVNTSVGRDLGGKGPARIIAEIAEVVTNSTDR